MPKVYPYTGLVCFDSHENIAYGTAANELLDQRGADLGHRFYMASQRMHTHLGDHKLIKLISPS